MAFIFDRCHSAQYLIGNIYCANYDENTQKNWFINSCQIALPLPPQIPWQDLSRDLSLRQIKLTPSMDEYSYGVMCGMKLLIIPKLYN